MFFLNHAQKCKYQLSYWEVIKYNIKLSLLSDIYCNCMFWIKIILYQNYSLSSQYWTFFF